LFSVLEPNLTQRQEKYKIQTFIVGVNKYMEVIRRELGIKQTVTTYAARHSFSTTLKRKGVPTSYIMEALGHSSMQITEHYLDSFTDDVKLSYAHLLTDL
jgi:integrase